MKIPKYITKTLEAKIAAIMDGATPEQFVAVASYLLRLPMAIHTAVREAESIASTGRERTSLARKPAGHFSELAWRLAKSQSFDRAKCGALQTRIKTLANKLWRQWWQDGNEVMQAILLDREYEMGRDEAQAIALAVAELPTTATAKKKSKEVVPIAAAPPPAVIFCVVVSAFAATGGVCVGRYFAATAAPRF